MDDEAEQCMDLHDIAIFFDGTISLLERGGGRTNDIESEGNGHVTWDPDLHVGEMESEGVTGREELSGKPSRTSSCTPRQRR